MSQLLKSFIKWLLKSFNGIVFHVSKYLYSVFPLHNASGDSQDHVLRGVMRVGLVAKGLLLKGDKDLELVLLCANKPTVTLLKQVAENLTAKLEVEQSAYCCFVLFSS